MYRIVGLLATIWSSFTVIPVAAQVYTPDLIELDGTNSLSLMPHPALSFPDQGAIEFWVVPDWTNDPGYDPVILSNAGTQGISYMIALLRDRDGLGIQAGTRSEVVDFDFSDGELHHVVLNDYGNELQVYIDAKLIGRFTGLSFENLDSSGAWIGTADGVTAPFVGAIAAMRFWSVPLDISDILGYLARDLLGIRKSDHPDIDNLKVISDFRNRDMLIVDDKEKEAGE